MDNLKRKNSVIPGPKPVGWVGISGEPVQTRAQYETVYYIASIDEVWGTALEAVMKVQIVSPDPDISGTVLYHLPTQELIRRFKELAWSGSRITDPAIFEGLEKIE